MPDRKLVSQTQRASLSRLRAVAGIAVSLGLLIAAVGPLVDHHYAERLPSHSHWYVAGHAQSDQHPYQVARHHADVARSERATDVPFPAPVEGAGFFPENDASLMGLLSLHLGLLALAVLLIPGLLTQRVLQLLQASVKPAPLQVPVPPPRRTQ